MVAQSTTAYARKDVDSDSEYKFDNTVLSQSNYYYAQLVKQIKVKSVSQYERNWFESRVLMVGTEGDPQVRGLGVSVY